MNRIPIPARGFSLVELLVGMVAGLVVVAGTVGLVTAVLASNSYTIKTARLNQDLNAMMAIMVSDLRRAGYNVVNSGTTIPFLYADDSSLDVTSSCLSYLYENDGLRNYAFRRTGNVIFAHVADEADGKLDDLDDTDKLSCASLTSGGNPLNDT
jgi:prepilin-type N-terminal cleavage/methylation domain-containing protein